MEKNQTIILYSKRVKVDNVQEKAGWREAQQGYVLNPVLFNISGIWKELKG